MSSLLISCRLEVAVPHITLSPSIMARIPIRMIDATPYHIWGKIPLGGETYLVATLVRGGEHCEESYRVFRNAPEPVPVEEDRIDGLSTEVTLLFLEKYKIIPILEMRTEHGETLDIVIEHILELDGQYSYVVIPLEDLTKGKTRRLLATFNDDLLVEVSNPLFASILWQIYQAESAAMDAEDGQGNPASDEFTA